MIDIRLIKKLRDVATTKIHHLYQGCCPDSLDGFDERDTECEACNIIIEIERIIDSRSIKGCHVDYKNNNMKPSDWCIHKNCVYDYDQPDDCTYTNIAKSKEDCSHWKEIEDFKYYEGL